MGEASVTRVTEFIERIKDSDKPVRIFYISDFDPHGALMPINVARKIEFYINKYGLGVDIKLEKILLTAEQRRYHKLPATVPKETGRALAAFEDTYGSNVAAELDALEALHPGEFARIVVQHIEQYYDSDLNKKYADYISEVDNEWEEACTPMLKPYNERIKNVNAQIDDIMQKYTDRISELQASLNEELTPFVTEVDKIRAEVIEDVDELYDRVIIEMPPRPDPDVNPDDDACCLIVHAIIWSSWQYTRHEGPSKTNNV